MGFALKIQFTDILQENSLKNFYVDGKLSGYEVDVRLGYYRGLYLSCVEEFELTVDGSEVPLEYITFCINDKEFTISELKYLVSEFWVITETAKIRVFINGGLAEGEHELKLKLMMRCPYLPVPGSTQSHDYAPIDSCDKKVLTLSC